MFRRRRTQPQVIDLRPGDTLVVQCEQRVPRDVSRKLQQQIQERFPDNRVLLLEAGLKLTTTIRKDPIS